MKVMVVDDSGVMRRIVVGALKGAGFTQIVEAADGNEAVAKTAEEQPGLILMDWNMPNLTGIDAVRQIREMGVGCPIIMVTTEAEKSRVLEAIKSGANNYVIKPFEPDTLIEKIRATLEKAAA